MADQPQTLRFTLPVDLAASAALRRRLRAVDPLTCAVRPDLELLLTELVTNVVRHAGLGPGDSIEVCVRIDSSHVRAEVRDHGRGLPSTFRGPLAHPDEGSSAGFGLYLVDRIADRWGTSEDSETAVWFELSSQPTRRGPGSVDTSTI